MHGLFFVLEYDKYELFFFLLTVMIFKQLYDINLYRLRWNGLILVGQRIQVSIIYLVSVFDFSDIEIDHKNEKMMA